MLNKTVEQLLPPFSNEGIDLIFTDPTDDDYLCIICLRVMNQPTETPCSHVFCKRCIEQWCQHEPSCPACRSNIQYNQLHASTYLQRKINQLCVKCEFNTICDTDRIQWQHYLKQHRYKECKLAQLLQHYIDFCNGSIKDTVITDISHVNDIGIKLLMYITDQLNLDRSNCIEKTDLTQLLFQYAEQQHLQSTQSYHTNEYTHTCTNTQQSSDNDTMYNYSDWSIKQLKNALKLKSVDHVDKILERNELEQLCRQNFIINKPSLPQPNIAPPVHNSSNNRNNNNTTRSNNTRSTSYTNGSHSGNRTGTTTSNNINCINQNSTEQSSNMNTNNSTGNNHKDCCIQ